MVQGKISTLVNLYITIVLFLISVIKNYRK